MKKKTRSLPALFTKLPCPDIVMLYAGYKHHTSYTICQKACRLDAVISRVFRMCSSAFSPASMGPLMFGSPPKNLSLLATQSSRSVASKEKLEKLASRTMCLSLTCGRSVADISNNCALLLIRQCSRVRWKRVEWFQLSFNGRFALEEQGAIVIGVNFNVIQKSFGGPSIRRRSF